MLTLLAGCGEGEEGRLQLVRRKVIEVMDEEWRYDLVKTEYHSTASCIVGFGVCTILTTMHPTLTHSAIRMPHSLSLVASVAEPFREWVA